MPSNPESSHQKEHCDHLQNSTMTSSTPPPLDMVVLEEKAEALRTDLLLRLEEMTHQMREAFDEASKTLFDTVSEWEQQAIDTLKADIRDIKGLEKEHKIRQEQLARFVSATSTSFADIFKQGYSDIQSPSPSSSDDM
ncbi:hypothetical protein K492DRAFT_197157 [Lichtheimia hyalospora FSU 10163]|nr:hypothetical protein K492DRAFT_197157 [Lichtheimia hyalospora FSU 10163]